MGLQSSIHPFTTHPLWQSLSELSDAERVHKLLNDANLRSRLVRERPDDNHVRWITRALDRTFAMGEPVDLEPSVEQSLGAQARATNRDPIEVALDALLLDEGRNLLLHPFENYNAGDLSVVEAMLNASTDPGSSSTGVGLEAGSKAELLAIIRCARPGIPILCNGFKDVAYIEMALRARRLGLDVHIIIEKPTEFRQKQSGKKWS